MQPIQGKKKEQPVLSFYDFSCGQLLCLLVKDFKYYKRVLHALNCIFEEISIFCKSHFFKLYLLI